MPAPSRITDLSAVAGNNSPTGGEAIGSNLDNYLRGICAAFRGDLAYVGANIATAASPDIGAIQGSYHVMTGNTTITGFVSGDPGIIKILEAQSTMPLIHSTTLPLLDSVNMTLQPGESAGFIAKAGGVWKQLWVSRGSSIPTGAVTPYAGSAAPTGWLICNGAAVSRSTYAALFAVISTTYGVGDGSTTFNLPDCTGRTVFGKESSATRLTTAVSGLDGGTLGAVGGSQALHGHTHTGTTGTESADHTHTEGTPLSNGGLGPSLGSGGDRGNTVNTSGVSANHTHSFTTASTGAGSSQNIPPGIVLNMIIKT